MSETIQTSMPPIPDHGGGINEPEFFRSKGRVGMVAFLCSEVAFFGTLVATYLRYLGVHESGPTPHEVLTFGVVIFNSIVLLSSSPTVYVAERMLYKHANPRKAIMWLWITMGLGLLFIGGTAYEWVDLMRSDNLYPWTNLFGTTFYTLIGFHALHVTIGVCAMGVASLGLWKQAITEKSLAVELISWYWHLVDTVWIVILIVVYILGR